MRKANSDDINFMLNSMNSNELSSKSTNSNRRISKVTGLEIGEIDDDFQSLMTSLDTRHLGINIGLESSAAHSPVVSNTVESYAEDTGGLTTRPIRLPTQSSDPILPSYMVSASSPLSNTSSTPPNLTAIANQKVSSKWSAGKAVSSDAFDFVTKQTKDSIISTKDRNTVQLGQYPIPTSQVKLPIYQPVSHQSPVEQGMNVSASFYPQAMMNMPQTMDPRIMSQFYPYPGQQHMPVMNMPFPKPIGIQTSQSDSIIYANNAILSGFSPELLSQEAMMQYGPMSFAPPFMQQQQQPWNAMGPTGGMDDKRFPVNMQYNGYMNMPQQVRPMMQQDPHLLFADGKLRQRGSMQQQQQLSDDNGQAFTLDLNGIRGQVLRLAQDRIGCRQLQQLLDTGSVEGEEGVIDTSQMTKEDIDAMEQRKKEAFAIVYEETRPALCHLMMDVFGNYLFQKIVERTTGDGRYQIFMDVGNHIIDAAKDLHGTRSVQRIIELCETPSQIDLIYSIIRQHVIELCIDPNGNHVIQRTLQFWRYPANSFVYEAVVRSCTQVSCHRHGCCVIQRCLDFAIPSQQQVLIQEIVRLAVALMQDPYGNYVIQYVLDQYDETHKFGDHGGISESQCRLICEAPLGMIATLCVQKFSSNVIEKCFEKAADDIQAEYVKELCASPSVIRTMIEDQYANYVLQKAVIVCSTVNAMSLVRAIRPHSNILKNTSGGRRIAVKLSKRFPQGLMLNQQISQYQAEIEEESRSPPLPSPFTVSSRVTSSTSTASFSPINNLDSSYSTKQQQHEDRFFSDGRNCQTQPKSSGKGHSKKRNFN